MAVVCLVFLFLIGAASSLPTHWVVGSERAPSIKYFPWVARLPQCTGSIIGKRKVLTALQCICHRANEDLKVRVGTTGADGRDGQVYQIVARDIPQNAGSNCSANSYDVAILTTDRDIEFSSYVKPIRLELAPVRPSTPVVMMGFGLDWNKKSGVLRYAHHFAEPCGDFLCTPVEPSHLSTGDFGGPLVRLKFGGLVQIGVSSKLSKKYSVFVSLHHVADFIRKNV